MELNSLARTLAERLIRKVALETLTLAELRGSIVLDDNEGDSIEESADDAIGVMLGEDWGCLDPEDPEDAAKILRFVNECEAVIREAIEKTLDAAINRIKSIDCTDEDYWAGVTAAIGKVESLKQSNSGRAEQGIVNL